MNWQSLSFVLSSESREKILKALESPNTPTRIAKETETSKAHVSRTLKEMEEREIVELKTPEKRKGKIYTLSEEGEEILRKLQD